MASLSYDVIFSRFLAEVEDTILQSMEKENAYTIMTEYLHKTMASSYISDLFSTYTLDDEILTLSYTLALITDDAKDKEFVATAIAKWMASEWTLRQKNSVVNTKQMFADKELKFFSQSAHTSELRNLSEDAYCSARKFIMDRNMSHNSYLGGA